MKRIGAMMLAGGLLLGSATGAAALERRTDVRRNDDARLGATRQNDAEKEAKRAFRQRIQAKQREYRELRRADDPRATQVKQEIDALKSEWTRLYGSDTERGQRRHGKADKVKKQHTKKPHAKRNH